VSGALSQQEIDALLSSAGEAGDSASGDTASEGKAKTLQQFDFRLPHRLSKNQLRVLQALHEDFAEAFASYMVSRLQNMVSMTVQSVDQLFYSEFVLSLPSPGCFYVLRVRGQEALAVMEVSPLLVLAFVEHLMGGTAGAEKSARPITRIEQTIVKGIFQRAVTELERAWRNFAELSFSLERYESERDFLQMAPGSEIVVAISFELSIANQPHRLRVCIPTFALEDVLARLNLQHFDALSPARRTPAWSPVIEKALASTRLPVSALLGKTTITVRDLLGLKTGSVIETTLPTDGEIQVLIGGKPRFLGSPGVSGGKLAVKISRPYDETATGE
jgi:flagellar motor switch protein FliM